ncbi:MAG: class I SAM-dependent methyltransferase [Crocinitomicaceae bacterium]|nr:class I SAM-dependent methyltransferase [Crocinitomicaceae bacterium]
MILDEIQGIDIYLLDQLMKGNINDQQRILDAGCGSGRNVFQMLKENADIICIDPNNDRLEILRNAFPEKHHRFVCASLETYFDSDGFDTIICNAVLHFAKNHDHFDQLFESLISNLRQNGVLFIRSASNIGLTNSKPLGNGIHLLPDNSLRYLITREKIQSIISNYGLHLIDPIKTSNVQDLRCMTTLVFKRN